MKRLEMWAAALALLGAGSGCASLESISVTNIPRERGRLVQAEATNPAFLGIHFSNDFADGVPDELRAQCPNGKVTGIYSKYETRWYVLVQSRRVIATGYCVPKEEAPVAPRPALVPVSPSPSQEESS